MMLWSTTTVYGWTKREEISERVLTILPDGQREFFHRLSHDGWMRR